MSKKIKMITGLLLSLGVVASYFYWSSNDNAEIEQVGSLTSDAAKFSTNSIDNTNELTAEKLKLFLLTVQEAQEAEKNTLKSKQVESTAKSIEPTILSASASQPVLATSASGAKLEPQVQTPSSPTKQQASTALTVGDTAAVTVSQTNQAIVSDELDSNKPEQLSEQPPEADPVAKYDALLAQVSLSEKEDSAWSQASQTAVVNLVESNPELQGLTLLEKNCWNTLCRFEFAPSSADQVASFNEKLDRISTLMPWPAPTYLKMNLENEIYPKATLYVAREGHSLPALN